MTKNKVSKNTVSIPEEMAEKCLVNGIFHINTLLFLTDNQDRAEEYKIAQPEIDLSFLSRELQIRVIQYVGQYANIPTTFYTSHIQRIVKLLSRLPVTAYKDNISMIHALYETTTDSYFSGTQNAFLAFIIQKDSEKIVSENDFINYTAQTGLIVPFIAGKITGNEKIYEGFHLTLNKSRYKRFMRTDRWGLEIRKIFAITLFNDVKKNRCTIATFKNHYRYINKYAEIFSEEARNNPEKMFEELSSMSPCSIKQSAENNVFNAVFYILLNEHKEKYGLMKTDIWLFSWFDPSRARLNCDLQHKQFNFTNVPNSHNKELIKKYCSSLIEMSDRTYSTMLAIVRRLIHLSTYFDQDFEKLTSKDVEAYLQTLSNTYQLKINNDPIALNNYLMLYIDMDLRFFEWMETYKMIQSNPFALAKSQISYKKKPLRKTNVSLYLIQQMFDSLTALKDRRYILCFLVVFETGMRISEACQLRKKDLRIQGECDEDGNFCVKCGELHYYSTKMKKTNVTFISQALTMLIHSYISVGRKDTNWLFPVDKKRDSPITSNQVVRVMKKWVVENHICTDDGELYHFREHDFRHFMAKRMKEKGLPIAQIQAQLSHKNIDMTLRYLDDTELTRELKDKQFFNAQGQSSIADAELQEAIDALANVHDKLETIFLPNGLCIRSNRLHSCPHSCACVNSNCKHFRTTSEYLPVHKKQLAAEKIMEQECTRGGYLAEAETHRTNIHHLEKLINALEGIDVTDTQQNSPAAVSKGEQNDYN